MILMAYPQGSPGWYLDPAGTGRQRYFDGTDWTEHYAPEGDTRVPSTPASGTIRRIVFGVIAAAALLTLVIVTIALVASKSSQNSFSASSQKPSARWTMNDLIATVCKGGQYRLMSPVPVNTYMCSGTAEGQGWQTDIFFEQFESEAWMQANPKAWNRGYSYATCRASNGAVAVFASCR